MPNTLSSARRIVKHLPQATAKRLPAQISVVPVSEKESRALNRQYRKKDKATNVLSFYYTKEYGEIIVCPSVIRHEAKAQKHSFEYQMTWMILHGMIHLSGLHHERSWKTAERTESVERKILRDLFQKSGSHHHHSA